MLGTTPIAAVLGSAPDATAPTNEIKMFARAAADLGLAVMLCAPGSKEPVDMRSSQAKRKDDAAVQEAAREAGRSDWARQKSRSGLYLATTDTKILDRFIVAYRKRYGEDSPINLGIEVGRSRRIVVDVDTTEQKLAFLRDAGITEPVPPTVTSPGAMNAAGEMVHYDGGHYYFTVPDDYELPQNVGMWTSPSGYAVLWRDRYVLIPPSTRSTGAYVQTGHEYPAPAWLLDRITSHAAARIPRAREDGDAELATVVDEWAERVPWADLLGPLGWAPANRYDQCGCDVWTAPGPHESPKSATTHDGGCDLGRYTEVNAPMHIWTHNPGEPFEAWVAEHGTTTLTKLQVYALANHEGKIGDAMTALGMTDSLADTTALDFGLDITGMSNPNAFEEALKNVNASVVDEAIARNQIGADSPEARPSMDNLPDDYQEPPAEIGPDPFALPTNNQCPHQDLTLAGRCTSCGDQVEACAHPNRDPEDITRCAVCGAQVAVPEIDGVNVHTDPTVEDADEDAPTPGLGFDYVPGDPGATTVEFPEEAAPDAELEDPTVFHPEGSNLPKIMPFKHWRGYPKPEFMIDGLLEQGGLTSIFGPSGVGKSVVIIDMLCHIASGKRWHGRKTIQQKVCYLPGEGAGGAAGRIEAWESAYGVDVGDSVLMGDDVIPAGASAEEWALFAQYVIRQQIGLIVFDTFARMAVGVDENSAKEVGAIIKRLDQVRKYTGAGVLVIHHSAKGSLEARGSSALKGSLDSELIVEPVDPDTVDMPNGEGFTPITVRINKQKNATAAVEPMPFLLTPYEDSVILTGPSGQLGDPLDQFVTVRAIAEPVIETAIRVQEFAHRFPEQGITRADAFVGVAMDDYHRTTKHPDRMWKLRIAEAVDLCLRFGMLETLSGTASGSRYLPTGIGKEAARKAAADAALAANPYSGDVTA